MARKRTQTKKDNKRKMAAIAALVLAAALLTGGAFAWTDFGQMMVNRMRGTADPDVQLHDDFDREGVDGFHEKDVYVENTGKVPVIVRIRFDEFFQVGNTVLTYDKEGTLSKINNKDTWQPRLFDKVPAVSEEMYHHFWNMSGNDKIYLRGVSEIGWKDWSGDAVGSVGPNGQEFNNTLPSAPVITMADYMTNRSVYDAALADGCWILDTDGWCYWSKMLVPDTATNLLLDSVTLNQLNHPEENYAYFINVKLETSNRRQFNEMISQGATANGANFISTLAGTDILRQNLQSTINLGKIISNLIDDTDLTEALDTAIANGVTAYNDANADTAALQAAIDNILNEINIVKPGYVVLKEALLRAITDGSAFKTAAATAGKDVTALSKALADGQKVYDRLGATGTEVQKATEAILAAMAAIDFTPTGPLVIKNIERDNWEISDSVWTSKIRKEASIMIDTHGLDDLASSETWTLDTLKNFDGARVNDPWLNISINDLFDYPVGVFVESVSSNGANGIYNATTNPRGFRYEVVGGILKIAYVPSYNEIHSNGFDAEGNPNFVLTVIVSFENPAGEYADLDLRIPFYGAWDE